MRLQLDEAEPVELQLEGQTPQTLSVAKRLSQAPHSVRLEVVEGPVWLDGFIVEDEPDLLFSRAGSAMMVVAFILGVWVIWKQRRAP